MSSHDILTTWMKSHVDDYRKECEDDDDVVEYLVMDAPSETGIYNISESEVRELAQQCVKSS